MLNETKEESEALAPPKLNVIGWRVVATKNGTVQRADFYSPLLPVSAVRELAEFCRLLRKAQGYHAVVVPLI